MAERSERIYYSSAAEQKVKRQQMMNAILFALLGLAAGAAIVLLMSTQDRIRKMVAEELNVGHKSRFDFADGALKKLEEQYKALREEVDHMLHSIRS